jgi:hypothetical protein
MNRYQEYGHQQLACHQMSDYLELVSEPPKQPFSKLETQSKSLRQLLEKFRKPVHYGESLANLWLVKLTLCNSLFSFFVLLPFAVITG